MVVIPYEWNGNETHSSHYEEVSILIEAIPPWLYLMNGMGMRPMAAIMRKAVPGTRWLPMVVGRM